MAKISEIELSYYTYDLPAPHCFSAHFVIRLKHSPVVDFELSYYDREEIPQEEIIEEGFTGEDDFNWNGVIAPEWIRVLESSIVSTNFKDYHKGSDDYIVATIKYEDSNEHIHGVPHNLELWEYLVQELMQAVLESSGREQPLCVRLWEIDKNNTTYPYELHLSFAQRSAYIRQRIEKKFITWEDAKTLLNKLFLLDFFPEKAIEEDPSKPGSWIDPGDQTWYKASEGIKNPEKGKDSILEWTKLLKELNKRERE